MAAAQVLRQLSVGLGKTTPLQGMFHKSGGHPEHRPVGAYQIWNHPSCALFPALQYTALLQWSNSGSCREVHGCAMGVGNTAATEVEL